LASERRDLLKELEKVDDLLNSISECLLLARARIMDIIDRQSTPSEVRSNLVIALGRINMGMRIADELRVKTVWRLKRELEREQR
jgi:hypothetical protein